MGDRAKVVLSGARGRMGHAVAKLIGDDGALELIGGVDREGGEVGGVEVHAVSDAAEILRSADAVIDFSAPEFLRKLANERRDELAGTALIVGTTGLEEEDEELLDSLAEKGPVLTAANFSVGVNVLLSLVETATRALGEDYDIEIVEAHHRRKEDAPSGTALALGEAAAKGREVDLSSVRKDGRSGRPGPRPDGEIAFHSLRGGDIIGDHQVHLIGALDRIEIGHRASDRALFAAGALRAAKWLAGREPGRYSMRQVLGL